MNKRFWIRLTGWAGLTAFVLFIAGLGLDFAAGPPPKFSDTAILMGYVHSHAALLIAAGLVISLSLMFELVMVIGVRDLIRSASAAWAPVGDLLLLAYVVAYPMGLVFGGLLIAAASEATSRGDASATGALWAAAFSLQPVTYLPLILGTAAYAVAIQRTAALPRWTAVVAWIAVLGGAIAAPAAFGGVGLYSQYGIGPSLLQGVPGLVWLLVVALSVLRLRVMT